MRTFAQSLLRNQHADRMLSVDIVLRRLI